MTIYTSTTLAELLDELEMGSPHMGAAIRERVTDLQDELEAAQDAEPNWNACPYCEENETAAEDAATRADELAAKVGEREAALRQIVTELRTRHVAGCKGPSPTLAAWADRIEAAMKEIDNG